MSIDVDMERVSNRSVAVVDPKLDEMFSPRWTSTDPNPAFVPRPHIWSEPVYGDIATEPIRVPMRIKDRVRNAVYCWLEGEQPAVVSWDSEPVDYNDKFNGCDWSEAWAQLRIVAAVIAVFLIGFWLGGAR